MLGDCFRLDVDSISVPNVVRLSLAVELDGASPESLRTSCSLDRAASGDSRWFADFGLLNAAKPLGDVVGGRLATVIGIGVWAAVVSS